MLGFLVGGLHQVVVDARGIGWSEKRAMMSPCRSTAFISICATACSRAMRPAGLPGRRREHPWGPEARAVLVAPGAGAGWSCRWPGARLPRVPRTRPKRASAPERSSRALRPWSAPRPPFPQALPRPSFPRNTLSGQKNRVWTGRSRRKEGLNDHTHHIDLNRLCCLDHCGHPSAFAASSTSSACPLTLTFGQTRATFPAPSIRTVVRSIPM